MGKQIYTLAQSETGCSSKVLVKGNGTDIIDNPALQSRAKRKVITQSMNLALVDVAKAKGESDRTQPYWNTYHCQSKIIGTSDKVFGNYCKNRFCTIMHSHKKS